MGKKQNIAYIDFLAHSIPAFSRSIFLLFGNGWPSDTYFWQVRKMDTLCLEDTPHEPLLRGSKLFPSNKSVSYISEKYFTEAPCIKNKDLKAFRPLQGNSQKFKYCHHYLYAFLFSAEHKKMIILFLLNSFRLFFFCVARCRRKSCRFGLTE